MEIYCCGCEKEVDARLTDGSEIYPHRKDLYLLPFWKCDCCGNYVGCHYKTNTPTKPLGCIPTPDIAQARGAIHAVIDPLWRKRGFRRGEVYSRMSTAMGKQFHSAEIRSVEEATEAYRAALRIRHNLMS